ncbi:hypothetical protein J1N35_002566 [Gossypium stocksii]|uniref:DEAD-box RNA helicase Q domain-containing protein n=1 Tax=Gossypium stocksii TaxID=47602 RepID=A0A9D3WMT0_9ROSI|nr:hypothetical protein J1N35_002566 [Gossypium stocksii]
MNQKRKRTKHDPELERLDSLPWNSSLPKTFSLFIGSWDLDGGFLSLEEIDESNYGLDVPGAKKKISNKISKLKKQKLKEVTKGSGEDAEAEPEPAEGMAEEKNVKAKTKKKKKKAKAVQQEDESATVIDRKDDEKEEMLYEDEAEAYAEFYAWNELRLHPLLVKSISQLCFKEPTPIQRACIPAAAHLGKDVVGAAETGSGKTLAFGLPIFQRLLEEREKAANMLEKTGKKQGSLHQKVFYELLSLLLLGNLRSRLEIILRNLPRISMLECVILLVACQQRNRNLY